MTKEWHDTERKRWIKTERERGPPPLCNCSELSSIRICFAYYSLSVRFSLCLFCVPVPLARSLCVEFHSLFFSLSHSLVFSVCRCVVVSLSLSISVLRSLSFSLSRDRNSFLWSCECSEGQSSREQNTNTNSQVGRR